MYQTHLANRTMLVTYYIGHGETNLVLDKSDICNTKRPGAVFKIKLITPH